MIFAINRILTNWNDYEKRKSCPEVFNAEVQWECEYLAERIVSLYPYLLRTRIYQAIQSCNELDISPERREFVTCVLFRLGLVVISTGRPVVSM